MALNSLRARPLLVLRGALGLPLSNAMAGSSTSALEATAVSLMSFEMYGTGSCKRAASTTSSPPASGTGGQSSAPRPLRKFAGGGVIQLDRLMPKNGEFGAQRRSTIIHLAEEKRALPTKVGAGLTGGSGSSSSVHKAQGNRQGLAQGNRQGLGYSGVRAGAGAVPGPAQASSTPGPPPLPPLASGPLPSSHPNMSLSEIERRMVAIVKGVLAGSLHEERMGDVTGQLWQRYASGPYPSICAIHDARLIALVAQGDFALAVTHYEANPDVAWSKDGLVCAGRAARAHGAVDVHAEVLVRLEELGTPVDFAALSALLETCILARDTGRIFSLLPRLAESGHPLSVHIYRRIVEVACHDPSALQLATGGFGLQSLANPSSLSVSSSALPERAALALRELVKARRATLGPTHGNMPRSDVPGTPLQEKPGMHGNHPTRAAALNHDRELAETVLDRALRHEDEDAACIAYHCARDLNIPDLYRKESQFMRLRTAARIGAPALAEAIVYDMLTRVPQQRGPILNKETGLMTSSPTPVPCIRSPESLSSALNLLTLANAHSGDLTGATRCVGILHRLRQVWLQSLLESATGSSSAGRPAGAASSADGSQGEPSSPHTSSQWASYGYDLPASLRVIRGNYQGQHSDQDRERIAQALETAELVALVKDPTVLGPHGNVIGLTSGTSKEVASVIRYAAMKLQSWVKVLDAADIERLKKEKQSIAAEEEALEATYVDDRDTHELSAGAGAVGALDEGDIEDLLGNESERGEVPTQDGAEEASEVPGQGELSSGSPPPSTHASESYPDDRSRMRGARAAARASVTQPLLASFGLAATLLGLPAELVTPEGIANSSASPYSAGSDVSAVEGRGGRIDTEVLRQGSRMEALIALSNGYSVHSYPARVVSLGAAEAWAMLSGTLPWPPGGPRSSISEADGGDMAHGAVDPAVAVNIAARLFPRGPEAGAEPLGMGEGSPWVRTLGAAVTEAGTRIFALSSLRETQEAKHSHDSTAAEHPLPALASTDPFLPPSPSQTMAAGMAAARVDVASLTLSSQMAGVHGGPTATLPNGNWLLYETIKASLGLPTGGELGAIPTALLAARPTLPPPILTILLRAMGPRALTPGLLRFCINVLRVQPDADFYAALLAAHANRPASTLNADEAIEAVRALRDMGLAPNGAVYGELAYVLARLGKGEHAVEALEAGLLKAQALTDAIESLSARGDAVGSTDVSVGSDGRRARGDAPPVLGVTGTHPTPLPSQDHFERVVRVLLLRVEGKNSHAKTRAALDWWDDIDTDKAADKDARGAGKDKGNVELFLRAKGLMEEAGYVLSPSLKKTITDHLGLVNAGYKNTIRGAR